MDDPVQVIIAVGSRIYREGLVESIQHRNGIQVVAAVASSPEAIRAIEQRSVDAMLLDVDLPGSVGAIRYLAACRMSVRVIAMSIGDTETDIHAWAALGVAGFVTTRDSLDDLIQCIVTVARDEFSCSPRHASMLLRRVAALSRDGEPAWHDGLTPRQAQIGVLLRAGLTNKLIARQLGIELATVKNHVHQILRRLHLRSRAELTKLKQLAPATTQGLPVDSFATNLYGDMAAGRDHAIDLSHPG